MFAGLDHSFTFATLIALLPCLLSWWSGTQLAQRKDDPVLPERFMAHQRRNGMLLAAGFVASAMVEPRALPWTGPLLFSTVVAAGYPVRRAIYGETWSFTALPVVLPPADDRRLRRVDRARRHSRRSRRWPGRSTGSPVRSPAAVVIAWDRHYAESLAQPAALPATRRGPAAGALPSARDEVFATRAAVPPCRSSRRGRGQRAGAAVASRKRRTFHARRCWSGWTRTSRCDLRTRARALRVLRSGAPAAHQPGDRRDCRGRRCHDPGLASARSRRHLDLPAVVRRAPRRHGVPRQGQAAAGDGL